MCLFYLKLAIILQPGQNYFRFRDKSENKYGTNEINLIKIKTVELCRQLLQDVLSHL